MTILSFGALIAGRLAYFGYPFPNTYYAKVSADRVQNVIDGAKYLTSFVLGQPFAEMLLVSWVVIAILAVARLRRPAGGNARTVLLAGAVVFGLLLTYVMLGGDHFALWRFYQPAMPLLVLPLVLGALWVRADLAVFGRPLRTAIVIAILGGWCLVNYSSYYQARFGIAREFTLSMRGENFGRYMSSFNPLPTMGVTAAGGIALTYEGELRDLLGLNWVAMAHANPMKVGFRNHASFDIDTFWADPPDLLPQYHRTACQRENWTERSSNKEAGVKQLFVQPLFQQTYSPVILEHEDGRCTNGFAANSWLELLEDRRVKVVGWESVTLLASEG